MTGVVLFSHGSLLCGAGAALEEHAERLRRDHGFPLVEVGYLNYTEPLFAEAAARLASAGATRIAVVPFFLAPGYFVTHSLPKCIETVQPAYPEIEFVIAEPLGADARLADAVVASASSSRTFEHWRESVAEAIASCRKSPECPLFGERCLDPPRPCRATPPASGGEGIVNALPVPLTNQLVYSRAGDNRDQVPTGSLPPPEAGGVARSAGVGLLVMVHGSPTPGANDEMYRVVEMVRERKLFPIIEAGFLECNEPAIPEAIESCIQQGATRIIAVPYFLHTGNHVAGDLPTLVEEARAEYPDAEFLMGEYIGRSETVTGLLAERAREALAERNMTNAGKA